METQKLNRREQYKQRQKPYDYYLEEFESIDFDSLGEGDRYYLQDFGIFNTDFLEDEFTIRIRTTGGRISAQNFSLLAELVRKYELTLIITARGGFQLHDVAGEDIKEIWHTLNDAALTTWQSFGDNVRNIVTDVYDGVGEYAKIETYPIIQKMQDYILQNPKYVGMLPRRVSIALSGNAATVTPFFSNDIYFALARKNDTYGFNVFMGGKNTEVAQDMDIFLLSEEVFEFYKAFLEMFYQHGSRFSRSKTRFYYMLQEHGIDAIKKLLLQYYPASKFEEAGTLESVHVKFENFHSLKDNTFAYCYETEFGKLSVEEVEKISSFAQQNNLHIRIGTDQDIYLLGLSKKEVPFESPALSSTIVACAGNLCPYAVWSIKEEASLYLPLESIAKHKIKVGFSGCAKGCGRHRHTDIGLIGLKTNNFGDVEGGARVFIGAHYDTTQSVSRQLFSMVPFVHLKTLLSLIITLFEKSGKNDFEVYAKEILDGYSEDFLALWYLHNLQNNTTLPLPAADFPGSFEEEKALLQNSFATVTCKEDCKKSVSYLVKKLWTVEGKDPHYKAPIERLKHR